MTIFYITIVFISEYIFIEVLGSQFHFIVSSLQETFSKFDNFVSFVYSQGAMKDPNDKIVITLCL